MFCEDNENKSEKAIIEMFNGISEEQLLLTINTIMQMEDNLKLIANRR